MTRKKATKKAKQPEATVDPDLESKFAHIENEALRRALIASKGYSKLSKDLGISRQGLYKWDSVPERFAVRLEELYGIPRALTAPHLYVGMKPVGRSPQTSDR